MLGKQKTKFISSSKLTLLSRVVSAFLLLWFSFSSLNVHAADFINRSVTIGSSVVSEVTSHDFRFEMGTGDVIGSLKFDYCLNQPLYGAPCTAPTGLVVNTANITLQTGLTGFTISAPDSDANTLVLTRAPVFTSVTAAQIFFDNITNQSTTNTTVFVRISSHASIDGSGPQIDDGAVVYYTVPGLGIGGFVPPYLTFCVGATVAHDCSTTNGSLLNLGELSENVASTSTSQFAGATNDPTGYNTYISGGTMTAGNEIIPALTSGASSQVGVSQFGMNLRNNSNPVAGANVTGGGTGAPVANYNTPNSFRYNTGELIARSTLPTEFNRYTVTYLVNVSVGQKPGIYASSFTYTAIASF